MTRTLKDFFEVYRPKSGDEQKFVDKHVTIKHKDRNGNGDDVFNGKKVKYNKRKDDRHGHDAGDDEAVYEKFDDELEESREMSESAEGEELINESQVGYKHFSITSGPKMAGMGEGPTGHIDGHAAKLKSLGIKTTPGAKFNATRRVTVKNNTTGDVTHHHVYQSQWNKNSDKPTITVRDLGMATKNHKAHDNVLKHYLQGSTKIKGLSEETNIFEELIAAGNPNKETFEEASMSHIAVMKQIALIENILSDEDLSPIKRHKQFNEAEKKLAVLEATRDIAVYKHIGTDLEEGVSVSKHDYSWGKMITVHDGAHQSFPLHPEHQAKIRSLSKGDKTSFTDETGNKIHAERTGSLVHLKQARSNRTASVGYHHFKEEALDELSKKTLGSYVKRVNTRQNDKAYWDGRDEGLSGNSKPYSGNYPNKKDLNREKGVRRAVNKLTKEEIEQFNEVSFKKLADYTSKSADSVSGAPVRKQDNRIEGQSLADKKIRKMDGLSSTAKVAATNEEALDELSKKTLASYVGKANDQIDRAGEGMLTPDEKARNTASKRKIGDKRFPGTRLAVKKYHAQNEEALDEISKKTLGSYIKIAGADREIRSKHGKDMAQAAGGMEGENEKMANNLYQKAGETFRKAEARRRGIHKAVDKLTKEEVEQFDELSKRTLGDYVADASDENNRNIERSGSLHRAKKDTNFLQRKRGINKAIDKLTKEDIINRAIEKYMPEDVEPISPDEYIVAMMEDYSENHIHGILELYDSLSEENQITMLETLDTENGINQLLDFVIEARGA